MPTTGASRGREGGRIGAGVRASKALANAPRVRVVGTLSKAAGKQRASEAMAPQPARTETFSAEALKRAMEAAKAAAESMGITPSKHVAVMASAVAGVMAVQPQPAGCKAGSSSAPRVAPSPIRAPTIEEAQSLSGHGRGQLVIVKPAAQYTARKEYEFDDVCALGSKLLAKTLVVADLSKKNADGSWLHHIPRTTMTTKWLLDDDVVMQRQGVRGVAGQPHWLVERIQLYRAHECILSFTRSCRESVFQVIRRHRISKYEGF